MRVRIWIILALACLAAPPGAGAGDQVRVVLDTSLSMSKRLGDGSGPNDPGRLAILATALLYDLAAPNTTLGDSFAVIPFDRDWPRMEAGGEPPLSTAPILRADSAHRDSFLSALEAMPYDGRLTYFFPGLARALDELQGLNADGLRVMVLITDGVPEATTREHEMALIRERLVPRLRASGVRLYVLAFGPEASRGQVYFRDLVRGDDDTSLGAVMVNSNARDLLDSMVRIFTRSFGYAAQAPRPVAGLTGLDLEGGVAPQRALALAMTTALDRIPTLDLSPPAGGTLNAPEPLRGAAVPGGAYALKRVLNPVVGTYGLRTDARQGQVSVLRPTNLAVAVLAAEDGGETGRAMAERPLRLRVRVASASGRAADPGEVTLVFRVLGERQGAAATDAGAGHAFRGDLLPPADNRGRATAEGREFDIFARFPKNPLDPDRAYVGYVEVKVYRGEAVVGELSGEQAHPIRIEPARPFFRYGGSPLTIDFGTLGTGGKICRPLEFRAEHYGGVPFELRLLRSLPSEHHLEVQLPREAVLPQEPPRLSFPGDTVEVCLWTGPRAPLSAAQGEDWLRLQVAGSESPDQGLTLRLTWRVEGLTLFQLWRWWILGTLALIAIVVLIAGLVIPARFSGSLALIFVASEEELEEVTPLPLSQWSGIGTHLFRSARAYLHSNFTLSGSARGALAVLAADREGARVYPSGPELFIHSLAGTWEPVGGAGRRARPGETYRIGERGPFFRISVRKAKRG